MVNSHLGGIGIDGRRREDVLADLLCNVLGETEGDEIRVQRLRQLIHEARTLRSLYYAAIENIREELAR